MAQRDFLSIISNILKDFEYLFEYDFAKEEYNYFKKIIDKTLHERVYHYQNFLVNVKTMKVKKEKIKEMISSELIKNNLFSQRA